MAILSYAKVAESLIISAFSRGGGGAIYSLKATG